MKGLESQSLVLGSWMVPFEIVIVEHKGLLFKIVTVEHKGLPSKIVAVEDKGLVIIFFLLVFLNLRKLILNCRTNSWKIMVMTWQLMWLILILATLNSTLQLLVIYRLCLKVEYWVVIWKFLLLIFVVWICRETISISQ